MNLQNYTNEQLLCAEYLEFIESDDYCDDDDNDWKYYIYEAALTAFYGEAVWIWNRNYQ